MAQMSLFEQLAQLADLEDETGFYVSPQLQAELEAKAKLPARKTGGVVAIPKQARTRGQKAARRKS